MTSTPKPPGARSLLAVVLAAGKGTRMRSALPKVLHPIAGRPMLAHVLAAVTEAGAGRLAVVVEPGRDDVARVVAGFSGAEIFPQAERLGTAHAVLAARRALAEGADDVVVAFGDTPLISPETYARLRAPLAEGAAVAVLAFEAENPTGYGRVLVEDGRVVAIREEKDASAAERRVTLCNAGLMALSGPTPSGCWSGSATPTRRASITCPTRSAWRSPTATGSWWCRWRRRRRKGVNDRVQLASPRRRCRRPCGGARCWPAPP